MKVFTVVGSTGRWDDYSSWVVCAYPTYELAAQHIERAKKNFSEIYEQNKANFETEYAAVFPGEEEKEEREEYVRWQKACVVPFAFEMEKYLKKMKWELDPCVAISEMTGVEWNVRELELRDSIP